MEWTDVGVVERLRIYPIKSGQCIQFFRADISYHGMHCGSFVDRQFMVVDSRKENRVVTGRQYPKMVLIDSMVTESFLELMAPNMPTIKIQLPASSNESCVSAKIWNDECLGIDLGDLGSRWINQYLNESSESFRILMHPRGETTRVSDRRKNELPLYGDESPVVLTTDRSLSDLNDKLSGKGVFIDSRSFRSSLHLKLKDEINPYDEDKWKYIKIGNTVCKNVQLLANCALCAVNPDNGNYHRENEPFKTLLTYRQLCPIKIENKLRDFSNFGINLSVLTPGTVVVGDKVYVRYRSKERNFFYGLFS